MTGSKLAMVVATPIAPQSYTLLTRIFLICRGCTRETVLSVKLRTLLARAVGKRLDSITIADVLRNISRFRCKQGHRCVAAREEQRKPPSIGYVASGTATERRTFHRDTCGWVGHIHKAYMIEFRDREDAWQSGFEPCNFCKP